MNEETGQQQAKLGLAPGIQLLRARQESNLSVEDVAAQLRLPVQIIIDIEKDDYSNMIFTFTRGYLRAYARLLGLPAEELVTAFNNLDLKESPRPQSPLTYDIGKDAKFKDSKSISHEKIVRWVSFLVIIGLVITVGLWWHNQAATSMNGTHLADHPAANNLQPATATSTGTATTPTDTTSSNTTAIPTVSTTAGVHPAALGAAAVNANAQDSTSTATTGASDNAAVTPADTTQATVTPSTNTSDNTVSAATTNSAMNEANSANPADAATTAPATQDEATVASKPKAKPIKKQQPLLVPSPY